MHTSQWMVSLFGAALIWAGCNGQRPCPEYPHTDPGQALGMHRSLHRTVSTVQAEARVDQWGREGRIRGTVLMLLSRPDRVRFDAMTQFGPVAVLTSDGENFQLTDLRESRYLVGPTCPENIDRLLGIPLAAEDVARFLVGDTPYIEAESQAMACGEDGYMITRRAADGRFQEIVLAPRRVDLLEPPARQFLRLRRSELFAADGTTIWRVTYDDYRPVVDPTQPEEAPRHVALPFEVHVVHRERGADTVIRYQSMRLNVEVPDEAFTQAPRPGMTAEIVGCD